MVISIACKEILMNAEEAGVDGDGGGGGGSKRANGI